MNKKSMSFNRIITLVLCVSLLMSAFMCFPYRSYAAIDKEDTETVKGMCSTIYKTPDVTYYSDDLFRGDSYDYDVSLAALSYIVCNSSYSTWYSSDNEWHLGLRNYLSDNGFSDFEINEDYRAEPGEFTSPAGCAHKRITDNGRTYTLLAVIPRSGTFGAEFGGNMLISSSAEDKGDHYAYAKRTARMEEFVKDYVKKYAISGDIKLWVTGYSGGAGIAGIFAADIIRDPSKILGSASELDASNLYCYAFSPVRTASVQGDYKDSRFDYIHNIYADDDYLSDILTSASFDKYGRSFFYKDYADKSKMLEFLKIDNEKAYDSFINSGDPDLYTPYKFDTKALLKDGNLSYIKDDQSYLPYDQASYIDSIAEYTSAFCAQSGDGDSRKGFYKDYQEPMEHMIGYLMGYGINFRRLEVYMKGLTGSKKSVPLLLSMYMSFVLNKSLVESSGRLEDILEGNINMIADAVENEDGTLKSQYSGLREYLSVRDALFTKNDDSEYVLAKPLSLQNKNTMLRQMKKLTAVLYAGVLREALEADNTDQEIIDQLTSEKDSAAASWFFANFFFGNSRQSKGLQPFSFENEHFKQAATLLGNLSRMTTSHMYTNLMEWYRAADPYYADYSRGTAAQNTGYRRVYISGKAGSDISGTVTCEDGSTAASFRNDSIVSRSDEWIGITRSDKGSWLRLPLDQSYTVKINVSKPTTLSVSVADHSVWEPDDIRSVNSDKNGSWKGMKVQAADSIVLSVPAAAKTDAGYDLTSADYSLVLKKGKTPVVVNGKLPSVKKVKLKASDKSFTVSWTKLSSTKRAKVDKIEVQYSTKKSFSASKTVSKMLSKSKRSLKVKGLKKGKTYYVRVRSVKYTDDATQVSKWSSVKKVKVK